jgi:hypothetical protein
MLLVLLAQAGAAWLASWLIWAIIVAAIVAIALVACRQMGVAIPPAAVTIGWILIFAVLAIAAIKFLMSMA